MSNNVAYKANAEPKRVHTEAPQPQPKKQILKRGKITLGEKLIASVFIIVIAVFAFKIIHVQAQIYTVNQGIQEKQADVDKQVKANEDLSAEVSDLSRYERVWQKAKELGLKLDPDNVKVVEGK
ncbi:cell division protein FtsL [Listeria weihenstephanensis FSL R9-0317]|uniref:Cell division protein FtsL n=1 Tax=Listeria weihenstephanensis TaxID=1006155 RepID=A0A1S7FTD1_9LIST|nr:cell division protein FtsL [Listeria weihenstephanensis]AQY50708.1 cell division protein FtsL [Listeria weihenstephanensis]EUJ36202.1 cell division protein FtsL [Listeria weihenstephanensis FSL R9-0317]MBC1499542.1 cell division protein FtsL [Listeria weihenstephanensis]